MHNIIIEWEFLSDLNRKKKKHLYICVSESHCCLRLTEELNRVYWIRVLYYHDNSLGIMQTEIATRIFVLFCNILIVVLRRQNYFSTGTNGIYRNLPLTEIIVCRCETVFVSPAENILRISCRVIFDGQQKSWIIVTFFVWVCPEKELLIVTLGRIVKYTCKSI